MCLFSWKPQEAAQSQKCSQNTAAKYKADSTTEEPQTSGENDKTIQQTQGNQADTALHL